METETTRSDDLLGSPLVADPDEVPVIVVNPGARIMLDSEIDAEHVGLAYLPPRSSERVVDPGLGKPGSKIKRLDAWRVNASIDTRGMLPGEGWYHITGEDDEHPERQVAEVGRFVIRKVPPELLGLKPTALTVVPPRSVAGRGLDMLGAVPVGGVQMSSAGAVSLIFAAGTLVGMIVTGLFLRRRT